jgi:hypothetical protein
MMDGTHNVKFTAFLFSMYVCWTSSAFEALPMLCRKGGVDPVLGDRTSFVRDPLNHNGFFT